MMDTKYEELRWKLHEQYIRLLAEHIDTEEFKTLSKYERYKVFSKIAGEIVNDFDTINQLLRKTIPNT